MNKNKKADISFIVTLFAICVLSFTVAFVGTFGIIAIVDNDTWQNVKNKYLSGDSNSKLVEQDLANVVSGTVELTITEELLKFGDEDFNYALTQEQKDNGFVSIKKNDDGSATYTIKKKEYKKYISELKETTKQGIDEIAQQGNSSSIKKIEYNDDLSKIVITADKERFENSLDSMVVFSCGMASCVYQTYDINAANKCTVEVKDSISGKVFQTTTYPNALRTE